MPLGGNGAEAFLEPRCHSLRECDLRQQDEHLRFWILPQCLRDGFEINLGLARACDAVEQCHAERMLAHHPAQVFGCLKLLAGEITRRPLGIGQREWLVERSLHLQ